MAAEAVVKKTPEIRLFAAILFGLAAASSAPEQVHAARSLLWKHIYKMATKAKRPKVDDGTEINPLQNFLQWCNRVGLVLSNKVCVSKEGTVAEYGMLATDNIEEGEVLFTVPRSALLHQETTKLSALLEKERSSLESSSGWVSLLLTLLYEYTSPQSHWRPYLSLWTDFKTLDHPMFWSKEERDRLLKGTGIPEAVDTDLTNIQREYTDVVLPFITKHPDLWNPDTHTLELYTKLVAFVMAYSFQEPQVEEDDEDDDDEEEEEEEEEKAPNPPMMVPMADMLNHVSNHNANLEFTPDSLKMVCVRPVHKGEEVFNTYGQMANWQLLHMYGFTEPHQSNSNDTADIPIANLYEVATQGIQSDLERQLKEEQWEMLCEVMQEKGAFVFGKQGCLTDTELHTALKVLCMSKEEFSEFKDNEGWEEDEDEEISLAFSNEGLPGLKASWKCLIHEAARLTARSYGDLEGEGVNSDQAALEGLSSRQQNALQVRCGQKSILHRLMELTKS
ncbi:N-lysine methyltransferase setd6 [Sebastes umbrosus]|uniref:N-lysine methyltransferase setd6 n=1 Tax=Sebastes umbrosus TaxID=72105 RepID=UPI0018A09B99|nr:N-lysine methyltransferase setd6 [Sebastes umbrosus]